MEEIKRVLKPDGKLILTCEVFAEDLGARNSGHPHSMTEQRLRALIALSRFTIVAEWNEPWYGMRAYCLGQPPTKQREYVFVLAHPVATHGVAYQARMGQYAIITPYYKESRDVLERCIKSVRDQTVTTDHFMVADGFPQDWIDGAGVRHIRLDRSHGDYGDTPRGIGAMIATSEGYEAIGFLDADCWLEPDHVQYCLELASQAGPQGCDYMIALRHERRPDGTIMKVSQVPPWKHIDTNCYFLLRSSFHVLPVWKSIPREVSIVGDRIFNKAIKANSLRAILATRKTVNYTCMWESIYRAMGEEPPAGAKPDPDHRRVQSWISKLPTSRRAVINRLIQTKLEELYPLYAEGIVVCFVSGHPCSRKCTPNRGRQQQIIYTRTRTVIFFGPPLRDRAEPIKARPG